jgi:hypothetical protein
METKTLIFRLAVIFGAVAVLGFVIYFNREAPIQREGADLRVGGGPAAFDPQAFKRDTDGDGLPDWEESLWGTDLNNRDTDGDGTSDAQEIPLGRDPLIPGPNDRLTPETTPVYARTDVENLTTTQAFERDYYRGIAQLVAEGQLNDSTLQTLIMGLTREYLQKERTEPQYTEADIDTTPDQSLATVRDYVNQLGVVAQRYMEVDLERELRLIQEFVGQPSPENRALLDEVIAVYAEAREGILRVGEVPYAFVGAHAFMLEGASSIERALVTLRDTVEKDPLRGMIQLTFYQAGQIVLVQGTNKITRELEGRNIVFSPEEPGHVFMGGNNMRR